MMKWLTRKTNIVQPSSEAASASQEATTAETTSFFTRLKHSLRKTRTQVGRGLRQLFLGAVVIDEALFERLETQLLMADFGVEATQNILKALKEKVALHSETQGDEILAMLRQHLEALLTLEQAPSMPHDGPTVILMVGVNGAGKTTTIGKLAAHYQQQGLRVMLAAGDTFRSAAVEQLQAWGVRHDVPVIAQQTGADSASVLYDAFQAAKARQMDVLIADTAGRLHTQHHLMQELKKVKRVLQKIDTAAPHEILLVLDASIGQNALSQAMQFHEALGLTGIVMTKLDGTAKGGILFAIAHHLRVPFQYLGIGERTEDLRVFCPKTFVEAIFEDDPTESSL